MSDSQTYGPPDDTSIRLGRRVVGVVGAVLGIVLTALSLHLPFGTMAQPGAALVPTLVGVAMVIICAATVVQSFQSKPFLQKTYGSEEISANNDAVVPVTVKRRFEPRVVSVVAMLIAYAIALPLVGFIPSSLVLLIAYGWLMARKDASMMTLIIYSAVVVAVLYLAFVKVFGVMLP